VVKSYQSDDAPDYKGTQNLEVMSMAVNYNRMLQSTIHKFAPISNTAKIYDFGAGTGQFTAIWENHSVDAIAIEIDPTLRSLLKKSGHKTVTLDDVKYNSADYIYTINVLEHIETDGIVMAELFNRLKHGGRLFIYVPAFPILWMPMDDFVGHVRRYRKGELIRKLKANGFDIDLAEYVDSAGFFATFLMRPFASKDGVLNTELVKIFDRFFFPIGRIMDRLFFSGWLGKNIAVVARKPFKK